MADSLRGLAGDFKRFLAAQEEDELLDISRPREEQSVLSPDQVITTAGVSVAKTTPKMAENSTLTVEFPRANVASSTPAAEEPAMNKTDKTHALEELAQVIKTCTRCPLGATRLNAVPGEGNVNADVMFVGEGPGFDEDRQGRPFVGRAGQLLDKMILAMGLAREKVFIANIAKCHPMTDPLHPEKHGNDRAPNAQEIACCRKYIEQQIAIVCPKYVVALGSVAAKALISDASSLGALRGKFHNLHLDSVELPKPVQILATYHPAALLRNPNWKKDAWKDLQMVMDQLGLKGARK
ncbi:MAG: uracil-DNA glycosylase [Elusimicrobiaceae bacterium]|nr:uracil-DNA glycosylase [Elusimicrobiaceae bacterium]